MSDKTLEADGCITIYEVGTSRIVAQYEGLEIHQAMERIAELEDKLARCNARLSSCQDTGNYAGMVNEELKAEVAALRERLGDADIALHDTQTENTALREVATAAAALHDTYHDELQENRRRATSNMFIAILAARAAGYLPAEGVSS